MNYHRLLIASIICLSFRGYSQNTSHPEKIFKYEFSLVSDNDNYTLRLRDGYYTNGIYFKLSYAPDISKKFLHKPVIKKVINSFELGQGIYCPYSYKYIQPQQQDRPFSGYLAFSFDKNIFYSTNNILELGISLGTIGPNSLGEEVQRGYHRFLGLYDIKGWPTQLKNESSVTLKVGYIKSLIRVDKEKSTYTIDGFAKGQLGNAFTNAGIGGLFRIGVIENNWNSSHWRARISNNCGSTAVNKYEFYFFYQPSITFQVYNATIQGGMFIKDKGPVTMEIKPFVFTHQLGVRLAQKRWTTALIYIIRSKEAKNQIHGEQLGSVQFAYRFKKLKEIISSKSATGL